VRESGAAQRTRSTTDVVQGDCLDETTIDVLSSVVDTAYYLVHSMGAGTDFADVDRRAAENFGTSCGPRPRAPHRVSRRPGRRTGFACRRICRVAPETGEVSPCQRRPLVEFRAGIVVGAGSLSFETIQALVERLPVMVCPRWIATLTQPIAVDDVLAYWKRR
jgi:uncharacterized protein YbjT (DUF2867 family)